MKPICGGMFRNKTAEGASSQGAFFKWACEKVNRLVRQAKKGKVCGLLEGDGFNQGKAPGEFLGVEDQRVIVVAGCDGEGDVFRGPDKIVPGHVDLDDEYPPLGGVVDLLEPDGPNGAASIEDDGYADLPGEVSVLDDGCHAGIMGERAFVCKGDLSRF